MPHWIQVELPPHGPDTGAIQIDLSSVTGLQFKRTWNDVVGVGVSMGEDHVSLHKEAAESFMKQWNSYIQLEHKDTPAEPTELTEEDTETE